jgi:hypothetical protein
MGNAPVLLPERGVAGDEVSGSVTAVGGRGVGERGCASAERVGQRPQVAVGVRERRRTQRSRVLRTSNIRDGIRGFSRFLCAPPSAQAFLKPWRYRWARRQESALWHSHRAGCSHAVRGRGMSSDWFLCGRPWPARPGRPGGSPFGRTGRPGSRDREASPAQPTRPPAVLRRSLRLRHSRSRRHTHILLAGLVDAHVSGRPSWGSCWRSCRCSQGPTPERLSPPPRPDR